MAKTAAQYEAEIKKLNDRLVDVERQMKSAFDPSTIAAFTKAYEKLINLIDKTEQSQLTALNKEIDAYDDITESLSDQLASQVKIINKLKDQAELTSKVEEIQDKLNDAHKSDNYQTAEGIKNIKKLTKQTNELNKVIQDKKKLEDSLVEVEKAKTVARIKSAKSYVEGLEQNIRKLPVVGDLFANTLMGPKTKRKLVKQFYRFFKDPKLKAAAEAGAKVFGVLVAGANIAIKEEDWWKKVQRSVAVSNDQIIQYRDNIYRASVNSQLELATRENLVEATNELNGVYGSLAITDTTRLENQVMMTKYLGLEGKEAAEIQRLGTIQGKDAEKVTEEIAGQVMGFNKLTGAGFIFNDIMKDVANSSETIKLQFHGSAKELANGIVAVKGFGLSLDQLQATGDELLDIESSISNQVQAQILTGKKINLDKARQLAFDNDLVGVAGELVKQGITSKDLTEGNRVGNMKLAASMGMSLDQLSKMVLEQEKFKRLGVDLSKGLNALTQGDKDRLAILGQQGDEEALKTLEMMKQATVQETLDKAMSDVKNIIAELAVVLLPILHGIANTIAFLAKFKTLIYGIIGGFITGGPVGAAIGASVGLMADASDSIDSRAPAMADGGVVSATPGGRTVRVAEAGHAEAIIPLNKSNLFNGSSDNTDMGETNRLLKELIMTSKSSRDVSVNIGDKQIGQLSKNINLRNNYTPGKF
jgi:hypothetical protein